MNHLSFVGHRNVWCLKREGTVEMLRVYSWEYIVDQRIFRISNVKISYSKYFKTRKFSSKQLKAFRGPRIQIHRKRFA